MSPSSAPAVLMCRAASQGTLIPSMECHCGALPGGDQDVDLSIGEGVGVGGDGLGQVAEIATIAVEPGTMTYVGQLGLGAMALLPES